MTPDLLRQAGEALFGLSWHEPLAHGLKVAVRTMQRWAAGKLPIPHGVIGDLIDLMDCREAMVSGVRDELYEALKGENR